MVSNNEKIKELSSINWDFVQENTQYLTHSYHQYQARFIPQIPKELIDKFSKKGDTILDPFCGCGTTLVESQLAGRKSIGIDLNPLACLISKVKTTPIENHTLNNSWKQLKQELEQEFSEFRIGPMDEFIVDRVDKYSELDRAFVESLPTRRKSDKFTTSKRRDLLILKDKIWKQPNQQLSDFYKVAMSSTISSYLTSRSKKIDLWKTFQRKVEHMIPKMTDYNKELEKYYFIPKASVYHQDARSLPKVIQENSIDLVITSPTYVNVFDYYRRHYYNMLFFDILDFNFRRWEIGAHGRQKENRFRLFTEYLADMFRVLNEISRVTKENGYVCITIGDSCIEFEKIHTHKHLIELGFSIGLEEKTTLTRVLDASNKYANREIGNMKEEYIIIFSKSSLKVEFTNEIIIEKITEILNSYEKHIQTSKGTCLRNNKILTEKRLAENKMKIQSAIELIEKDIRNSFSN